MGNRGGGAVWINSGDASFNNCTFSENSSTNSENPDGAQTIQIADKITIVNSIVWQNNPGTTINVTSLSNISNSCIQGGWDGNGNDNISADPEFIDDSIINGNLRLLPSSPAINTGDNAAVTEPTDLDGLSRIVGGTVDMGAYEYRYIPLTTVTGEDGFTKDRYLSFNPGSGRAAIRVRRDIDGIESWVGCMGTSFAGDDGEGFDLVDSLVYCNWQNPVIHVTGC